MYSTRDDRLGGTIGRLDSISSRVAAHAAIDALLAAHVKSMSRAPRRSFAARLFGAPVLTPESHVRYTRALAGSRLGSSLESLGPGWVVLNAVPLGDGHPSLDHLVIGPGGVIALTIAASDRDELWDSAPDARRLRERRALRESEFAIGAVERRLAVASATGTAEEPVTATAPPASHSTIRVTGLIVSIDRSVRQNAPESPDLHIVPAARVAEWILALPPTLSTAEVSRIAGVAELNSTWHTEPHPPACGAHLLLAFEALQREVRSAERRRRLWLLSLPAALVGMVVTSAFGVLMQVGLFG